ncbi:helix-turn-helix domain-containing protein [Micromonospora sp. NPDC006766]|uniref:helix-turn-helix domain-containing protein n=1 Tax=Micromonospora sp. NPDC006766 TaxID=3154778 RepID=UPI0033F5A1F4
MSTPPLRHSFAARFEHLLSSYPNPVSRRRYSDAEIAAAIGLSKTAVWNLRTGQTANPTWETIHALAEFFGVTPGYFFGAAEEPDAELRAAMADAGVRHIATRAAGVSPESQQMILDVLETIRRRESGDD